MTWYLDILINEYNHPYYYEGTTPFVDYWFTRFTVMNVERYLGC